MKERNKKKRLLIVGVVVFVMICLDQIIKCMVSNLELFQKVVIIPNLLSLKYVHNTGSAYSFQSENFNTILLLNIFSCIVFLVSLVYCCWKSTQQKNVKAKTYFINVISFGLIFAGSTGNLIDRIVRGYVIDYIKFDFCNSAIYNLADLFVYVGYFLFLASMIWCLVKEKGKENTVT